MAYRNRILATLGDADRAALEPHLTPLNVAKGDVLIEQGSTADVVHFPETAFLANLVTFSDGTSIDTALVGLEGLSGLAPFLAEGPCAWQVVAQLPGLVYAAPAVVLRARMKASTPLYNRLIRLTHDYQSQASQSAACNALHPPRQRLARWLLLMQDRAPTDEVPMTHQDLATVLGMTRTTVTESAVALKKARAISYTRGHISIDRGRLERQACECYVMQRDRSKLIDSAP